MDDKEIDELSRILFYEFSGGEYEVFRLEVLNRKIKDNKKRIEQVHKILWNKNEVLLAKMVNLLEQDKLDIVKEIFIRANRLFRKKEMHKLIGIESDFGD
ncbi:MAG: hypothetical protein ACTSRG_23340 [Candidatus Helarchaeota archaeon]